MTRALVGNAADRGQVEKADRHVKLRREQELNDLRAVLGMEPGRRYLYRIITALRPQSRLWEPGELTGYRAARHDVAVELLNEIDEASPDAQTLMMREARERQKFDEAMTADKTTTKTKEGAATAPSGEESS